MVRSGRSSCAVVMAGSRLRQLDSPGGTRTELADRRVEGDSDQRGRASGRVRGNASSPAPVRRTSPCRYRRSDSMTTSRCPRSTRELCRGHYLRGETDNQQRPRQEERAAPDQSTRPAKHPPSPFELLLAKAVGPSGNLAPIRQATLKIGGAGNVGTRIRVQLGGEPRRWTDGAGDAGDNIGFELLGPNWRRLHRSSGSLALLAVVPLQLYQGRSTCVEPSL